jgi:hypothetical protein
VNILAIVLASTLVCQAPQNANVIGLWESTAITRGGIGHNIKFRSDGSYKTATVVLVDLAYDIRNGKLYISKNRGEPVNYEQGARIELNESEMILLGDNGQREVRKRLAVNGEKSIIGKYKYRHYTGAIAYEQYTADGLMKLRLPMSTNSGCYSLDHNMIIVSQTENDSKNNEISVSSDATTSR